MKYKIGDTVKIVDNKDGDKENIGKVGKIVEAIKPLLYQYIIEGIDDVWCDEELELVNSAYTELKNDRGDDSGKDETPDWSEENK